MIEAAAGATAALDAPAREAIDRIAGLLIGAFEAGGRAYVCGNGGSAADAQHIAAELVGRFRRTGRRALPCVALTTDTSALTAVGNDFGFEQIFARQVDALGRPGDVLWAISTSGRSPNVLAAAERARALGMTVVSLTGPTGGQLCGLSEACLRAPGEHSDQIQQVHQVAYHIICEIVDEHFAARG